MNQESIDAGVLYIDDTAARLDDFKNLFGKSFNIYTAQSIAIGQSMLARHEIGVIIIDHLVTGTNGINFCESIAQSHPRAIKILLTGFSDADDVSDAINKGLLYACLPKPWQNDELKNVVKNALEVYYLRKHNIELTYKLYEANYQLSKANK
jgi:DNA-binding NtrC family response regulator